MMTHKGYSGHVWFDGEADIFHGEVMGLRDVVTFQGTTVDEVKQAFRDSIDDYLAFCAERNESPEKAYSGKFMVRVEPQLHRRIAEMSAAEGLSLNGWLEERLRMLTAPESPPKYRPRRRGRSNHEEHEGHEG